MAASVYTELLGALLLAAPGTDTLGPPDVGYRWVFTDLDIINLGGGTANLNGFDVTDDTGVGWFSVRLGWAQQSYPYHWTGRQVIDEPSGLLRFVTHDDGWSLRATGYVLTLP